MNLESKFICFNDTVAWEKLSNNLYLKKERVPLETMALESSTNDSCRSEKTISLVWGCELTRETPTYTFEVPDDWSYEQQQLALRTICLGEKAKDEFHAVEIVPPKNSKGSAPVCIANLKPSVLPMVTTGLDLNPPVTFKLRSGSGPVYIAGQHVTAVNAWNDSEEEEESSQEDEEMEESSSEESPVKPIKAPASKHSSVAKKETELPAQEQSQTKGAGRLRKPAAKK